MHHLTFWCRSIYYLGAVGELVGSQERGWLWERRQRSRWSYRRQLVWKPGRQLLWGGNPREDWTGWGRSIRQRQITVLGETAYHAAGRADSLEETLMRGKIAGRRRRGPQRMRWLDGITDSVDVSLASSGRLWRTRKPGMLWVKDRVEVCLLFRDVLCKRRRKRKNVPSISIGFL